MMFERIRHLKKKINLELCRWMGPGQGRGCLCAPPTPTSTACLWGVGWITEGFLQDFTEKNIFFSHLQPLRSSPIASTNRNAANLATLKCRLYAFLASHTVIKRRCIMREQKGDGCGGVRLIKQRWPTFCSKQATLHNPTTRHAIVFGKASGCCSTKSSSKKK